MLLDLALSSTYTQVMNRTWSFAGLVWTFLRMALLLLGAFAVSAPMVPGDVLFLFTFASGTFGMAALYLLVWQNGQHWSLFRVPLLIGSLLGLLLVLVYTSQQVFALSSAGIALAGSAPTLLAALAQCAVITVDGLFSYEIFRGGR